MEILPTKAGGTAVLSESQSTNKYLRTTVSEGYSHPANHWIKSDRRNYSALYNVPFFQTNKWVHFILICTEVCICSIDTSLEPFT